MKTNEEYIKAYWANFIKLKGRNELWRLNYTLNEFILKVKEIRDESEKRRKTGEIQLMLNGEPLADQQAFVLLLQNKITYEEALAQAERMENESKKKRAEEAPQIQKELKMLQTPLSIEDMRFIYRALWRKYLVKSCGQYSFWKLPTSV